MPASDDGFLDNATFGTVLRLAPLVSIDLVVVVKGSDGQEVLVGLRTGEPAAGAWFVPGGRIRKGEGLDEALARITETELGFRKSRWDNGNVLGVFTHHYDSNALGIEDVGTDYVVVGYVIELGERIDTPPVGQHSSWRWVRIDDEHSLDSVHPLTRAHLRALAVRSPALSEEQYAIMNSRRDLANNLVWQTPIVGLTGIAFLFVVLLAGDTSIAGRVIAAVLTVAICLASWQLTAKQRWTEETLATELEAHERQTHIRVINHRRVPTRRALRMSSVVVWKVIYLIVAVAAVAGAFVLVLSP